MTQPRGRSSSRRLWHRLLCRLFGHAERTQGYTECGPGYTGYLEHSLCDRCGHDEIVQVPQ